jgi:hypothetical protein
VFVGAAGAVRVRPLALSPRDLLPLSTSQVERTAGRPRGAKARSPEVAGLAAQVPSAAATPATLRDQGRAALRPLMEVLDTGVDDTHPDLQGKISDWAEFDANGHHRRRRRQHVAGRPDPGAGIPVVTAIGNEGEQPSGSPGNDLFA